MNDLILETMQSDIAGILRAVPGLADAQLISVNEGNVEADVAQKLAPLSGEKRGLAVIVHLPELTGAEENQPGPVMDALMEIQVIESVLINRSEGGTGIRCTTACLRILAALHHTRIGNTALYAKRNPMKPLPGKRGIITYALSLYAEQIGPGITARTGDVEFAANAEGRLELSSSTVRAEIYYTTDDSFPGPANPAATLYTAAIVLADQSNLRTAAYAPEHNPSSISEVAITLVEGAILLNGYTLTMGGAPLIL